MTEEEKKAQEEEQKARESAIAKIKLEESETKAVDERLKSEFPDLVGDDLEKKRKEFENQTRTSLYEQAEKDGKLFETIKSEKGWEKKSDDEIWEEVNKRNADEATAGSLDKLMGGGEDPKKKKKKDKDGKGTQADADRIAELEGKLDFYEKAFEKDTLLKNYTDATKTGQSKKFLELLQGNPVLTMNIEKADGKSLYEAHLKSLNAEHGDSIINAEQIADKVESWDSLDPEDKAKKISEAKTHLTARQADLHKEMGATLEAGSGQRQVDTKAVAKMYSKALNKMKGTNRMGLTIDDSLAEEVFEHIKSGKFNTRDPKTGLPLVDKIIDFALLDLKKAEIGRSLYNAGVKDTELRHARKTHRSASLYKNGIVRHNPNGTDKWEQKKSKEKGTEQKINMSV